MAWLISSLHFFLSSAHCIPQPEEICSNLLKCLLYLGVIRSFLVIVLLIIWNWYSVQISVVSECDNKFVALLIYGIRYLTIFFQLFLP